MDPVLIIKSDRINPPSLKLRRGRQDFLDHFINRRRTQICADIIFSLLDLSKEKLHALRANSFNLLRKYNTHESHTNITRLECF